MSKVPSLAWGVLKQPDRLGVRVRRFFLYVQRFGFAGGLKALFMVLASRRELIRLSIPQSKTPLTLRTGTSDILTFEQIFVYDDYDLATHVDPRLIIDGGANVGLASIYFANRYPDARIIAVEPDESNAEMLRRNTSPYPNVTVVQAGIWHRATSLAIENPEAEKWLLRVKEAEGGEGSVEAVTIGELLERSGAARIDILKLDIEGAEREVFSHDPEWLGKVDLLIIELHDHYKPGCSASVYSAISKYDFTEFQKGENLFLVSSRQREAALQRR
ncbi:MAG TPA: FkbM family methyltransferase [Blastocatellia bacterium]|nr:FkbM family methyltransferase [Blastocatellia bacterium]